MEEIKKKIQELIDKSLEETVEQFELKENEFHASMIGLCSRYLYFAYKEKLELTIERVRVLAMGKILHSWLEKIFSKLAFTISEGKGEIDIDGIKLIGTFDTLLFLKPKQGFLGNKEIIIELKTVSSISGINDVLPHHKMQVNFYLNTMNVDDGFVIYVDRKSFKTKIFHLKKDEKLFEETKQRAMALYEHLKSNKIPPAEARMDSLRLWECSYCPFVEKCDQLLKEENSQNLG